MSHKEMYCLWSNFLCQFPDSGYFSETWIPKQVKQISAIEQGKLLLAELDRDFLEVEGKGYLRQEKVGKKGKGMSRNFNIFNSRKPNSIKLSATSVSFKEAGGCWISSRKRTMTYIVVKNGQRHKKWKVKSRKVCNIIKLSLGISRVL